MKALFLLTFALLISTPIFAQYKDLDKMPEKERNIALLKIAEEAVDKWSDGYDLANREISITKDIFNSRNPCIMNCETGNIIDHTGKKYPGYIVKYHATEREMELFYNFDFFVKVLIFAKTGKAAAIFFIDGFTNYSTCTIIPANEDEKVINKNKRRYIGEVEQQRLLDNPRIKQTIIKPNEDSLRDARIKRQKEWDELVKKTRERWLDSIRTLRKDGKI